MLKIGFFWLVNFKYFFLIFKFRNFGVFCLCFKKRKKVSQKPQVTILRLKDLTI